MASKKRAKGGSRGNVLSQMHDAAQMIEGALRNGIEAERMVRSLSKVPPKKWIRIGLQGLIRALEHGDE